VHLMSSQLVAGARGASRDVRGEHVRNAQAASPPMKPAAGQTDDASKPSLRSESYLSRDT
jgi:hypothetical protein